MSTYRLDALFNPRSVALVGVSPHDGSLGRAILTNVRAGGFPGRIHLVNPSHAEIDGIPTVKTLDDLSETPDMAVVTTPAAVVPEIVTAAGRKGVAGAVIITAGLGHGVGSLAEAARQAARPYGLRLVGPNCLGIIAPFARLNASFAAQMPQTGDLALISQSGAIAAGLVQWATQRRIGFSAVASIGDRIDVDFGDLLDFFATDRHTRAILLYIEAINDARKFMSAARLAARIKPVVVIKSGRHAQAAQAAATHTGALAGTDAVYDAAFRRAGLLRVGDLRELFNAAETLGRSTSYGGARLAILTNGGGIGVLAVDRLIDLGGTVAALSPDTRAQLDRALPPTWSRANPVDIIGDADGARYVAALEPLLADNENDAVLIMQVPTAMSPPSDAANAIAAAVQRHGTRFVRPKPVFAAWIGEESTAAAAFEAAGLPHFASETDAVQGFMHIVRYHETRAALMQAPPSIAEHFTPDVEAARRIVATALSERREWLDPVEIARLFESYGMPIVSAAPARDADEAAAAAQPFLAQGGTVAVKIFSHDITHKSDVGGVQLNLASEQAVRAAVGEIMARAKALRPDARVDGVTIHPMIVRPKARELIVGLADDPTFGPVVVFGRGGIGVEVINDKALALPPLDLKMAHDLIARTRVSRLLKAYRDVPAAREDEVALALVKLAQLAADVPEICALDINPLLADETGILALDARVSVVPVRPMFKGPGHPRFAVRPYPREWERHLVLADDWRVFVRPVRPEDEDLFRLFFTKVTMDDLRLRFFAPVKDFGHNFIARLTQLDYARAMAFVAIEDASGDMLGAVRLHADANYQTAEFAILLRSDLKGRGLGWRLMELILDYGRSEGLRQINGQILRENTVMIRMCRELGFDIRSDPEDPEIVVATLALIR
jgi:acetyltransferase